ncbi:protein mono-ADP-ribosyltransferase PARP14-like [Colossoma macropomum]|uniref:protein mono-ADP-ribosyltransferase PARP14-like n=1 Tax=Colossoma macropomum TaxID=42526 RepID=UPI0018653A27|nr:protein mono-ADP-ribosyltransferase PARP14-like [Colossoma macropomum]
MAEKKLLLEGLPDDLDCVIPKLELYFKNKKRSGGEAARIQEHPEDKRKALLVYLSEGDVQNVLARVHQLDFRDLGVAELTVKLQLDEDVLAKKLKPPVRPRHFLKILAVKEHDFGFSVEAYKEENVAEKWDPHRFILTGFKDVCKYKIVTLFISSCSKKAEHTWELLDEDRIAVTFKEDIDVNNFLFKCTTKKPQGMDIRASHLELTDSVLVQGDMGRIKEDLLTGHFGNKMKSGGGDIKSLVWIISQNSVVITFKDYHDLQWHTIQREHVTCNSLFLAAYRVLDQRHHLCGEELTVLLFYSSLQKALTGETPTLSEVQTNITIPVDVKVLHFIENNEQCKNDLQSQLKMVHAKVLLDKTTFPRKLVVEMTVDKESLAALQIGPTWENKARKAAQEFLTKYSAAELAVELKVWKSVESTCLTLITPEVDIFFEQTDSKIVIVGLMEVVSVLLDKIKNLVKGTSAHLVMDRKTIMTVIQRNSVEKIPLKSEREMEFIKSFMNLSENPEIRNLGISLEYACDTLSTPCLNVTTAEDKIQDAITVVRKQLSSIVMEKLIYSRSGESKVLEKNEANVKAKAKGWNCTLYFEQLSKVGPAKTFKHKINSCTTLTVSEGDLHQYTVDTLICPLCTNLAFDNPTAQHFLEMGSPQIQEVFNKLQKDKTRLLAGDVVLSNPGNLSTKTLIYAVLPQSSQTLGPHYLKSAIVDSLHKAEQSSSASVAMPVLGCGPFGFSLKESSKAIREAILQFISDDQNTPKNVKDIYVVDSDMKIVEEFNILVEELGFPNEITPTCPTTFLSQATMQDLKRKLDTSGPRADDVILTGGGNLSCKHIAQIFGPIHAADIITSIEKVLKLCESKMAARVAIPAIGTANINGVRIEIKKGNITNEKVQAIVNTTNREMDLKAGVSGAIFKAAGPSVEKECQNLGKCPLQGDMVALTSAGNLQSNFIIHMIGPHTPAAARLRVKKVLERCEQKKISTVSFPAVGTGGGGLKSKEAMTAMLQAFEDHLSQHSFTAVELICVVVDRDEVLHEFLQVLKEWTADTQLEKLDPELMNLFHMCGISEAQLKDKEMSMIIFDFIEKKGGVEALKEQLRREAPKPTQQNETNQSPAKQPLISLATALAAVTFPVMTVEVYGTSPADLAKVKKLLDDLISEECTSRDVRSSYLTNLQEADKEAIVTLSKNNQVHILVSSSDRLTVSGKKDDVLDTVLNISSFIQAAKEREAQESEIKRLSETLCWEVAEGEEWVPLDSSISYQLELAFHKKEQSFTYEVEGEVYTVDLKELTQENSSGKSCRIKRTLIGDSDTAVIQPPPTWTKMEGRDLAIIPLVPDSDEYKKIETAFLSSSQYPDIDPVEVVQIRRIQNKGLWQRYAVLKQEVDKKYPDQINEQFLYHGTTKEISKKINKNGFNRSFCGRNAVVHGHGTYFAMEAWYSCQHRFSTPHWNGLKYIYRARVVTGTPCKTRRGMKEPDPLDPNDPRAGLYDCAVDNLEDPFIFVVFCDAGAYPDYLIIFKNT